MAAKRGYKLQEFVAHESDVKCLSIGKKSRRIFLTGGEDFRVNLWEFGKPISLLSLAGHTSSVQSVTFDSAEVLVLAGSSNGTMKLWDLEEAKLVRTVSGHRSNCTAVEFHPFGEFFASGSSDTDLKIWDIRKKGCIHTYKGHTRGIRTIRFSPDGRWVVTGGEDHVVKVWDLTAGKLLHDFKFHNGIIQCIDFHPQEFLLATGSADRTVNFWDLETFELIGSAGPEAKGVRSMVFHPDGRTLFCGFDETLKVFSWEPIRCHDYLDMGWSTLGDLSIYEGKLLGCSYHQSQVGVWIADISLIGPYALGVIPKNNLLLEPTNIYLEDHPVGLKGSCAITTPVLAVGAPDPGEKTKDIDCLISNISCQSIPKEDPICMSKTDPVESTRYMRHNTSSNYGTAQKVPSKLSASNSAIGRKSKPIDVSPGFPNRSDSNFSPRERPLNSRTPGLNCQLSLKADSSMDSDMKCNTRATGRPLLTPVFVPREDLDSGNVAFSRKSTASTETKAHSTASRKIHHVQQPPSSGAKEDCESITTTSRPSSSSSSDLSLKQMESGFISRRVVTDETIKHEESKSISTRRSTQKFERVVSLEETVLLQNDKDLYKPCSSSEASSIKYVRGVAVQLGRTRSLVERFEKRERCNDSNNTTFSSSEQALKPDNSSPDPNEEAHATSKERDTDICFGSEALLEGHDVFINLVKSRLTKLQVVRHFWERDGIKGAIDAVVKLPDYSVQVDVLSGLMEKINLLTLDSFSCLLPLLYGLLNSKIDRHVIISLELLFEFIKTFGPILQSSSSASLPVGVDLQAEQRLERSKHCYTHIGKIKQLLPFLIRNGGLLAKHAQKLNVALNGLLLSQR